MKTVMWRMLLLNLMRSLYMPIEVSIGAINLYLLNLLDCGLLGAKTRKTIARYLPSIANISGTPKCGTIITTTLLPRMAHNLAYN